MRAVWLVVSLALAGCSTTGRVALLSDGALETKILSGLPADGPLLEGSSCGIQHYLSEAFREAVAGTPYDTLMDVRVTTRTHPLTFGNCVTVEGRGVDSRALPDKQAGMP